MRKFKSTLLADRKKSLAARKSDEEFKKIRKGETVDSYEIRIAKGSNPATRKP